MERSNKPLKDIAIEEFREFVEMVTKYSPEQLAKMAIVVNINSLQEDMIMHGATEEELLASSELWYGVNATYSEFIDQFITA